MKIASKLLILAACGVVCSAYAAPSGPSAKMAARLKKRPTSSWLAHYLPDDRYKIAGGVWKYVSTDLDTYYHRPDSPNMLRQPASRVIGFASAAEAEEAGYRPDASVFSSGPLILPRVRSTGTLGGRRVYLSDKVSSILLPPGWRLGFPSVTRDQVGVTTRDTLIDPQGQLHVIMTMTSSNMKLVNFDRFRDLAMFGSRESDLADRQKRIDTLIASTPRVNSRASRSKAIAKLNRVTKEERMSEAYLSGLRGIKTVLRVRRESDPRALYSFGKGRKLWGIYDNSKGSSTLTPILNRFRLR